MKDIEKIDVYFFISLIFGILAVIFYLKGFINETFYPIALIFTCIQLIFLILLRIEK